MIRSGSVRNSGGLPGDDMIVDKNLACGGGHHEPRPYYSADGEGIVAVAAWASIAGVAEMRVGGFRVVGIFVDDAISFEFQRREDGARCKVLMASLVDAHFQRWERGAQRKSPWCHEKTGWITVQGILGLWVDTEDMTRWLTQRKLEDL